MDIDLGRILDEDGLTQQDEVESVQDLIDRVIENLGPGSVAGSKQYIIDRIGEFQDAGIAEIMFGGINSGDVERLKIFEQEVVSEFR